MIQIYGQMDHDIKKKLEENTSPISTL